MLLKLAWRNLWRNKRRSLIVLLSVIVGVNAMLFMDGMTNGMLSQILFNQISLSVSHIQIHNKGFNDDKTVQGTLENSEIIEEALNNNKSIDAYSRRVITFGLLSSASNSTGVYLYGIVPEEEEKVSRIKSSIIEGSYLGNSNNDIVIGKKLAEKLKVQVGDKVVAMANTPSGRIGSEAFRIAGLFKTPSSEFDKSFIYVQMNTAQSMLDLGNSFHEFAIITKDYKKSNTVRDELISKLSERVEVLSYEDLLPFIIIQLDMYKESMFVVNFIIGLALIFGIVNSMLMSVFERIQEIGVLMSIGMRIWKIFGMVVLEAFILGTFGTVVGIVSGYLINIPFSIYGIDLSFFAQSLESYAMGSILYPQLSIDNFIMILFMIPIISVVAALYPAYRAIKLEPVYAIRYV